MSDLAKEGVRDHKADGGLSRDSATDSVPSDAIELLEAN